VKEGKAINAGQKSKANIKNRFWSLTRTERYECKNLETVMERTGGDSCAMQEEKPHEG